MCAAVDTEEEKADMFRRIKAHKGRVCFSALDPLQTAKDKRFFDVCLRMLLLSAAPPRAQSPIHSTIVDFNWPCWKSIC